MGNFEKLLFPFGTTLLPHEFESVTVMIKERLHFFEINAGIVLRYFKPQPL